MRRLFTLLVWLAVSTFTSAADPSAPAYQQTPVVLHTATGDLFGTLALPQKSEGAPVALIIAGSGPTDRNGNQPTLRSECLSQLAHGLAAQGIASLRFDKRAIAQSAAAAKSESDLRFEDYVHDTEGWIALLKADPRFSKVVVVGHSEGSLIGMLAAPTGADGFISVAGAGQPAAEILKEQLGKQPEFVQKLALPIVDSLVAGRAVTDVNPMLAALFRPSVQPYLISWFHYNPQTEIAKLKIPVLIIQGLNDIQVSEAQARMLAAAYPTAELALIPKMNHVFKDIEGDRAANIATYNKAEMPTNPEMLKAVGNFILKAR